MAVNLGSLLRVTRRRRTPWLLVAVAFASVAWAPEAMGAAKRSTGTIAYVERGQVRLVSADGKIDRAVAPRMIGTRPTWSPNGRQILFHNDDPHSLVVMTPGSASRRVLYAPGEDRSDEFPAEIAWSPAGGRIAFTRGVIFEAQGPLGPETRARDGLFVMNSDGTGMRELLIGERFNSPTWSRDGKRIAYLQADASGAAVWSVDVATGAIARLFDVPNDVSGIRWSPRADLFSLARQGGPGGVNGVWIVRSDGGGLRRVVSRRTTNYANWSPDGRELVFTGVTGTSGDIYTIRTDGTGQRRLTRSGRANIASWGRGVLSSKKR